MDPRGGKENPIPAMPKHDPDSSDDDVPLAERTKAPPKRKSPAAKKEKEKEKKPPPPPPKGGAKAKAKPPPTAGKKRKAPPEGAPGSQASPSKAPRRTFELPGQTRETPDETDSSRRFYVSCLAQNPHSEMALRWCMQHGCLSQKDAAKAFAKIKAKDEAEKRGTGSTPTKRAPPSKAKKASASPPAKKGQKASAGAGGPPPPPPDDDDDFA